MPGTSERGGLYQQFGIPDPGDTLERVVGELAGNDTAIEVKRLIDSVRRADGIIVAADLSRLKKDKHSVLNDLVGLLAFEEIELIAWSDRSFGMFENRSATREMKEVWRHQGLEAAVRWALDNAKHPPSIGLLKDVLERNARNPMGHLEGVFREELFKNLKKNRKKALGYPETNPTDHPKTDPVSLSRQEARTAANRDSAGRDGFPGTDVEDEAGAAASSPRDENYSGGATIDDFGGPLVRRPFWSGGSGLKLLIGALIVVVLGVATAQLTGSRSAPGSLPGPGSQTGAAPVGGSEDVRVDGDLGLDVPMSRPPCDGTGIVILASLVTPGRYEAEVQRVLERHPGASYLRTDQACSSLRQATEQGDPIYAVYRIAGFRREEVCAAVRATGGDAYGKWLDMTTPSDYIIRC